MTDFTPKDTWPLIPRKSLTQRIPHAYMTSIADTANFYPDWKIVAVFEEAMDAIDNGSSFREVADWLNSKIDRKVSHSGIREIWFKHRGKLSNPRYKEFKEHQKKIAPITMKEKLLLKAKRQAAAAKRSVNHQNRIIAKLSPPIEPELVPVVVYNRKSLEHQIKNNVTDMTVEVAFKPNDGPQTEFLMASEREVLYGGAAGGGKSYGLIADPMRYFGNKNFSGLLLRRTVDELRELISKAQDLYFKTFPGTKWQEKQGVFTFPAGGKLWMAYLDKDDDVRRYQGFSFNWIGIDELTHYATPYAWNYLRSRLRSADPTLPLYMRATSNPGGPGHGWVKKMFTDPAPYNTAFPARNEDGEIMVHPDDFPIKKMRGKPLFYRRFIPAKLVDNPYLYADGQYMSNLISLPEQQRRQLLEGDWSITEGSAFPEFRYATHVIKPFPIPPSWRKFRSCDYGYTSWTAVHWYALDPVYDTIIVYRELYITKKTGKELAPIILDLEKDEKILYGILDSSVWSQRGQTGPSIAEEMIAAGCRWRPSDRGAGSRVAGRNRLHELLKVRDMGISTDGELMKIPGIQFFDTCRQIIADLPVIPTDPKGGEDIDDRYSSDHAYDSIRYGIMSRPRARSVFDFNDFSSTDTYQPVDPVLGY